jgi:glucose-1-phosphate adenylyltransferase
MAEYHWEAQADITVAVQPVAKDDAVRFGLLKREADGRITAFTEKPKDQKVQAQFVSRDDPQRPYLGSMGIYLFNTHVLVELLTRHPRFDDFGGDIIPEAIRSHEVYGYDFDDYWEDIGTIRSFYETNLQLTRSNPPFNFYDPQRPIYTHARFLPGSVVADSDLQDVLLAEGCRIQKAEIRHAILGVRSQVSAGACIQDSIIMGSDYYDAETTPHTVPLGIGPDCHVEGAILDKNARLGAGVVIQPFPRGTDMDRETWFVRDGIVVIPKSVELPSGTRLTPQDKH